MLIVKSEASTRICVAPMFFLSTVWTSEALRRHVACLCAGSERLWHRRLWVGVLGYIILEGQLRCSWNHFYTLASSET